MYTLFVKLIQLFVFCIRILQDRRREQVRFKLNMITSLRRLSLLFDTSTFFHVQRQRFDNSVVAAVLKKAKSNLEFVNN